VQKVLGCFQEWLENSEEPMENFTSEKEIIMTHYFPLGSTDNFHTRKLSHNGITKYIKITGNKDIPRKCSECHQFLSPDSFHLNGTKNASGHSYLYQACKPCKNRLSKEVQYIAKNAPPRPDKCDCCNLKTDKLTIDHKHGTLIFRGFLCRTCNIGYGNFKDSLKGILRGAIYLEPDIKKIIETLNGIKNERI
jgi:hypothetical protein